MGGALHSLAWAGPLHPSPNCQLSAEMHADQLSSAGRGEGVVNSTCSRLFCKTALETPRTDAAATHVHVFNRDNRLTSGLMLVFDRPGLSRSSTISLMACSIRSLREEGGERRKRGRRAERKGRRERGRREGGRREGERRKRGRRERGKRNLLHAHCTAIVNPLSCPTLSHLGNELDELHKDVEWHVLWLYPSLAPREQRLHYTAETTSGGRGGGREGKREERGEKREGRGWREGGGGKEGRKEEGKGEEREKRREGKRKGEGGRREREGKREGRERREKREVKREGRRGRREYEQNSTCVHMAWCVLLESGNVALPSDTHHVHPGKDKGCVNGHLLVDNVATTHQTSR